MKIYHYLDKEGNLHRVVSTQAQIDALASHITLLADDDPAVAVLSKDVASSLAASKAATHSSEIAKLLAETKDAVDEYSEEVMLGGATKLSTTEFQALLEYRKMLRSWKLGDPAPSLKTKET